MSARLVWTEQAKQDLFDGCEYLAGFNLAAAVALSRDIEAATSRLAGAPNRGRRVPELIDTPVSTLFREIIVRHFRVVYLPTKQTVVIHAVLDSRRDLEQLLLARFTRG